MSNVVEMQKTPLMAGASIKAIVPTSLDDAYRLAKAVCMSGLAPKGLEKPEAAMVAIMHGLEIGLTPMMALQKISVINGRPTLWGDGALGLVRGSGVCEGIDERIEGTDEAQVATCEVRRKGEAKPIVRSFSVADAKKAGLWGKAGPWQQYPQRMLQMRARAFALRDGFADVLGGMYLTEELQGTEKDVAPAPMRDVTPEPRRAPPPPPVQAAIVEAKDIPFVDPDEAEKLLNDWHDRISAADKGTRIEILEGEVNPAFEAGKIDRTQYEVVKGWVE